jgi:hypothetical protein
MLSHRALARLRNAGIGTLASTGIVTITFGFAYDWQMVMPGETLVPALSRTLALLTPFLIGCGTVVMSQATLWHRCSRLQDRLSNALVRARKERGDDDEHVIALARLEKDSRHMFGADVLIAIEARAERLLS